ncbi:hypothetical protein [Streptomyces gobiensis]|uniref:hypothetical protein n=1 Tax=Streptomyces gobiensis TaxID=2875706 RepID=UPI001E5DD533|nr:hypothetical protein [Streptomyces gobiensis]UGY91540.1 hypothetical protein test1122_07250 [Streptomyces gobiensis]
MTEQSGRVAPAEQLLAAVETSVQTLRGATARDWGVRARGLENDCRAAAEHIADNLIWYAASLARQATERLAFLVRAEEDASPEQLTEVILAGGQLLATVGATVAESTRAYHPAGMTDPESLIALGAAETLLHTDDITASLGVPFDAPPDTCRWLLARLLPEAEVGADSPWQVLRWATGRAGMASRPPVVEWNWRIPPV